MTVSTCCIKEGRVNILLRGNGKASTRTVSVLANADRQEHILFRYILQRLEEPHPMMDVNEGQGEEAAGISEEVPEEGLGDLKEKEHVIGTFTQQTWLRKSCFLLLPTHTSDSEEDTKLLQESESKAECDIELYELIRQEEQNHIVMDFLTIQHSLAEGDVRNLL
ncbi:hypothetical protein UY3_03142 [Chelonia mydas]|uniref:Uncharacterized protein n=1 Tax=Chelonia mydas TaxID=8469 RepID=M7CFG8_CHEMY|nr:hypothetical protein UY3_03142 [Chelonia mydas]